MLGVLSRVEGRLEMSDHGRLQAFLPRLLAHRPCNPQMFVLPGPQVRALSARQDVLAASLGVDAQPGPIAAFLPQQCGERQPKRRRGDVAADVVADDASPESLLGAGTRWRDAHVERPQLRLL